MEKYVINGGNKLYGTVKIESSKNAVLPILASSVMCDEKTVILDCPKIADVLNMIDIMKSLGVVAEFIGNDLVVDPTNINSYTVPSALSTKLRSSVLLLGALIGKMRKACVAYPGGCEIGIRPIDIHISGLRQLGVSVSEFGGDIVCTAEKLKGAEIYLDFPSVGATENIMIASVLAEGKTVIHNSAKEPEIIDLADFLNKMGAKISYAGSSDVVIEGVKKLFSVEYKTIPDRIEAGTFAIATAISGGEVEIKNVNVKNISSLVGKLCNNSCNISISNDIIYIKSGKGRKALSIKTGPYPFFPTDLQPQMTSLLSLSQGVSVIEENVFEMRYKHVGELIKMGADINVVGRTAIINGVSKLHGADVKSFDLRGGASMVLAGLGAEGKTTVSGIRYIERGYLDFDKKLSMLGADIKKYT